MKINTRQICFIMIAYTVVTKLLTLPSSLSIASGRDLLFSALINFGVCGIVIWALSFLCSKTDKTFFELLSGTVGNVGARIVYGLFALFFVFASILPIFEQKLYVHAIFYDTVPSLSVFLPFFVFSIYAGFKKFENIGRCADICLPIFVSIMLFIFVMSYNQVHWDNLLPVLKTPAKSIFAGAAGTAFDFVEPCWLLMFMGHFKYKKGDAAKITLSYAAGAAVVLFFLAVFYGIYGDVAPSRFFAISRTAIFFPAIETIGRIDLILLYVLETVMLFALVINIQFAVHAFSKCTGYGDTRVISLCVNLVLFAIIVTCEHMYSDIHIVYYQWLWIVFIVFVVVLPLLAWTLRRRTEDEA